MTASDPPDLDSRTGLALDWATSFLGQRCAHAVSEVRRVDSNESVCLLLGEELGCADPQWVLKVSRKPQDRLARIEREFRQLQTLWDVTIEATAPPLSPVTFEAAEPLAISREHAALLMTYLDGTELDDRLRRGTSREWSQAAAVSLVEGLAAFYRLGAEVHGDLTFTNILASERSVALIDPGLTNRRRDRHLGTGRFGPLSVDLGRLLFKVSFSSGNRFLKDRRLLVARVSFARRMVSAASQRLPPRSRPAFIREVDRCARDYIRRPSSYKHPRQLTIYVAQHLAVTASVRGVRLARSGASGSSQPDFSSE